MKKEKYIIENVTDQYEYSHEYETVQSAIDTIKEYEEEDIIDGHRLNEYTIIRVSDYEEVYNSFTSADKILGQYVKKAFFGGL